MVPQNEIQEPAATGDDVIEMYGLFKEARDIFIHSRTVSGSTLAAAPVENLDIKTAILSGVAILLDQHLDNRAHVAVLPLEPSLPGKDTAQVDDDDSGKTSSLPNRDSTNALFQNKVDDDTENISELHDSEPTNTSSRNTTDDDTDNTGSLHDPEPTNISLQNTICNLKIEVMQLKSQHKADLQNADYWIKLYMLLVVNAWDRMNRYEKATLFETMYSRRLILQAKRYVSVSTFNYNRAVIQDTPNDDSDSIDHDELHSENQDLSSTQGQDGEAAAEENDEQVAAERSAAPESFSTENFFEGGGDDVLSEATYDISQIRAEQVKYNIAVKKEQNRVPAKARYKKDKAGRTLAEFASTTYVRMVEAEQVLRLCGLKRAFPTQYQTLAELAAEFVGLDESQVVREFRSEKEIADSESGDDKSDDEEAQDDGENRGEEQI